MDAADLDEFVLRSWKSQGTSRGMSVLDSHEVIFPMIEVGAHHSKWITVKNPSQQPVVMQLILNSGEIIDECKFPDGLSEASSSNNSESQTPMRYGFSIAETAIKEAYVQPYDTANFGPVRFHPLRRCGWRSSALIRNNLSGVECLSLRGSGGSFSLVLFEESKPVQNLEFKFNWPIPLNISPDIFHHTEETTYTCSKPVWKELYAKNTGDLPLEVKRIEISGAECELDGFVVHSCKSFALEPGESTKLLISYQADFAAVMMQRDLELALATGIIVIPMKATLPLHMLSICRKSVFWMRLKKLSVAILFAAFVILLLLSCVLPQLMTLGFPDYLLNSGKSSIATIKCVRKTSCVHHNQKDSSKLTVSADANGLPRPIEDEETLIVGSFRRYPVGQGPSLKTQVNAHSTDTTVRNQIQTDFLLGSQKVCALSSCERAELNSVQETSLPGKLIVKIGKEKGRKRRKRKGSGTGLTGIFDLSSSQSGNSTPSSPLSPAASSTPKRSWPLPADADQSVEARKQFAQVGDKQCENISLSDPFGTTMLEHEVLKNRSCENCPSVKEDKCPMERKMAGKPVLLPCATFPCTNRPTANLSPFLASTSTIAPHARAPGAKLYNQKIVETEEKTWLEDQFRYDIWGDHLFGLHLSGRSKEVTVTTSGAEESHSNSFFVRGPQSLMAKSQGKSISSHQEG